MKIDILTMHSARNYGAVLQTFALQHVLEKKYLFSPRIINYVSTQRRNSRYFTKVIDKYKHSKILSMLFIIATFPTRLVSQLVFSRFVKKHLHIDKRVVTTYDELFELDLDADFFVVGSDQVWNPIHNDGIDKGFFLDFVADDNKKISYASSIGTSKINIDHKKEMHDYLSKFKSISYREFSSKFIFDELGLDADWVLDPTLLMDKDEWHEIATNKAIPSDYLLLYWFGNTKGIIEKAKQIAKDRGLRIVRISTVLKRYEGDDIVEMLPSPERFVQLFENASFVVTDSFHGSAFSINFNKEFYAFPAKEKDDRFYSLFEMFNVYDRDLREEYEKLSTEEICYDRINLRLEEMREKSHSYLKKAFNKEP